MFYDPGCRGSVPLGRLPADTQRRLQALTGDWLEFDRASAAVVVRHVQPTATPSLPAIAGELVAMLAEIPDGERGGIIGGDLLVHTDGSPQLVRLRVEPGGAVHIRWARPDYASTARRPWERGAHALCEPQVQRLNGELTLRAATPARAAERLQAVADSFEGLYPEGEFVVETPGKDRVEVSLTDVNLDAELLVTEALAVALPRSLSGRFEVGSFVGESPEHYVQFVLEDGGVWIQRPVLWGSDA